MDDVTHTLGPQETCVDEQQQKKAICPHLLIQMGKGSHSNVSVPLDLRQECFDEDPEGTKCKYDQYIVMLNKISVQDFLFSRLKWS